MTRSNRSNFGRPEALAALGWLLLFCPAALAVAQEPGTALEMKLFKHLREHESSVFSLALAKDKKSMLSCGVRQKVVLWDTRDWKVLASNTDADGKVLDVAFSADERFAFALADPQELLVFELPGLKRVHRISLPFRGTRLAVHPEKQTLAVCGIGGRIVLVDYASGDIRGTVEGHAREAIGICFTNDGNSLYSGGYDVDGNSVLRKWQDDGSGRSGEVFGLPATVKRLRTTNRGQWILIPTFDKAIVLGVEHEKILHSWNRTSDARFQDLAWWAGQKVFVTGNSQGLVEFWQPGNSKPVGSLKTSKFDIYRVMPIDEETLAVCTRTRDKSIAIWKVKDPGNRGSTAGDRTDPKYHRYPIRTWTSASGKHTIEARAILNKHGIVHLKKTSDGKIIQLAVESLSKKDQEFLKTFEK